MTKSVLITGCSSGIGWCAAQTLRQRGYRVFATARKPEAVNRLTQQGLESLLLDVNDSASIKAAVAEILSRTGNQLYALINNAGYGQPGAVEDLTRELLRAQFETNLFGLQELTNLIIPIMRNQGYGRIINISSVLGLVSMPYRGAYNASKFALEGLTDSLRLELRGSNIYVSLIEPGPIVSQFRENALTISRESIAMTTSRHKEVYQQMLKNTQATKDNAPFTLPPDAVVKKMIHALESRKPKRRYYVTFPTYLLASFKRVLPTFMLDWIINKITQREIKV